MASVSRLSWAFALCLACVPAVPESVVAQDEPAAVPSPLDLFNGKNLAGWKLVNTEDNFFVKDGLLVMNGGQGWLATEKTFGDFELRLVYRFRTRDADSGVFIRSSLDGKNWTDQGYQIQNADNASLGKVVGMGKPVRTALHSEADVKNALRRTAQWNQLTIVAVGDRVVTTLNGVPAGSATIDSAPGHIGLQAEGAVLEFREIVLIPH